MLFLYSNPIFRKSIEDQKNEIENRGQFLSEKDFTRLISLFTNKFTDTNEQSIQIEINYEKLKKSEEIIEINDISFSEKDKVFSCKIFEDQSFPYHGFLLNDTFFNNSIDLLCIANTKGEFVKLNPEWEKLTGLKSDVCIGKTVTSLLPNIEKYWIETYGNVAKTGISTNYVNYLKELDSYYETYAFCPEKGYFAVVFNDITEKRKYDEKFSKLTHLHQIVLDTITFGIAFLKDRIIQWINHLFEQLFGYQPNEIIGKHVSCYNYSFARIFRTPKNFFYARMIILC